jgi:hypothetical protein
LGWKKGISADNIAQCGDNSYIAAVSDEADNSFAETFTEEHLNSRTRLRSKNLIGRLNSVGSHCLLSIMSNDKYGWEIANKLLLLSDRSRIDFDLIWANYRSDRFLLSKDARFVLTYQGFWPRQTLPGRVVVLSIAPPSK